MAMATKMNATNGGQQHSISILNDSTTRGRSFGTRRKGGGNALCYILATALLSGTVCYRLGMFAGCASSWLSSIEDDRASSLLPNDATAGNAVRGEKESDPDDPSYYGRGGSGSRPTKKLDPKDRRTIPRTNLPYDCGVVFFYHIPSTGGRSINQWLRKYKRPQNGNVSYYQYWEVSTLKDGLFHADPDKCEAKFAEGMNEHIQNLGPNEWRVAHSHVTSTYLNESEDLLNEWRSDVEAQGCEMINTIMLRDPLNHAMSLHKIVHAKNSTWDDWAEYLYSPTGTGKWGTVLDFFLYNIHGNRNRTDYPNGPGGRNPFNVTREVKVARALELLHRHFDVVTVADHAAYMETVLEWTGWPRVDMPKTNVYKKDLHFTKKEVEKLQKLLQKNGDFDFVDQVKLEYHDYLSYLKV